jgi:hypothetical protein
LGAFYLLFRAIIECKYKRIDLKENPMKKVIVTTLVCLILVLGLGMSCYAQMAKEGTGNGKGYYVSSIQVMPMEKERAQMNYEGFGIFAADDVQTPFHNMSQHVLGGLHVFKGDIDDSGFIEGTLTTGDKVFMTYKASGKMGKPSFVKGTFTYVGGTGKFSGIEGGGEFTRYTLQPPAEGKSAAFSVTKANWKIVEPKK